METGYSFFIMRHLPQKQTERLLCQYIQDSFPPILSVFRLIGVETEPLSNLYIRFGIVDKQRFSGNKRGIFYHPVEDGGIRLRHPNFIGSIHFVEISGYRTTGGGERLALAHDWTIGFVLLNK